MMSRVQDNMNKPTSWMKNMTPLVRPALALAAVQVGQPIAASLRPPEFVGFYLNSRVVGIHQSTAIYFGDPQNAKM
jgi:hypothetical protein